MAGITLRLFVFCSWILFSKSELFEGSTCVVQGTNRKGICKLLGECQEAIDGIKKGKFPQICTFIGKNDYVCCPVSEKLNNSATTISTRKTGEISSTKCKEYHQYIWKVEANPTLRIGGDDLVDYDCPFEREKLIVGGSPAQSREFPHMVQIGYDIDNEIKWACGGSLISDQYVLTAAHCLDDLNHGLAEHARMGITDIEDEDHLQQFRIQQRIPYPDYQELSHYHDIGLAKLNSPANLSTWVRPACIHNQYSIQYTRSIASGWGRTGFGDPDSPTLMKIVLEMFDQKKCNSSYESGTIRLREGIKDDIMLCAGSSTELLDTCQGDSGGPLQVYKGENKEQACLYDIIGVTVFGRACGLVKNVPGVYARVSYYVKWIEDHVWP
ncbi:venom protease-like [Rhynchophorus ferrugineus]|uniref:venom protease-like n=1 Tax=Rhynchophorus ferrugineus TaxID=354439 RepID=UPI003FCE01C1